MFGDVLNYFLSLTPMDLLFVIIGVTIGLVFGFLPGLGGTQAIALLLPLTFGMEPTKAMLLLIAILGGVPLGGSVSAILMNTPGTPISVATSWDGYPLAMSGKANVALGASAVSSGLGALFGVVVLFLILPIGRSVVLAFSYPEYFSLALVGLCVIVLMEQKQIWKGFISLAIGLILASVGYDPVTGAVRLTFGSLYLWEGISLIPTLIGLFAISEGIKLLVEEQKPSPQDKDQQKIINNQKLLQKYKDVFQGIAAVFRNFRVFTISSIVGVIVGIIPGIGGAVSNILAYTVTVQTSKDKSKFGKGDIRGVIAPEAANDAKDGGGLVPTLLFGIPGTAELAVFLGALLIHGVTPGPRLIIENPLVVYSIIVSLVLSNVIATCFVVFCAPFLSKIPSIRPSILGTSILILALVGSYATNLSLENMVVAMIFGVLGYFLNRFGFSKIVIVMALVLGSLLQQNLFRGFDVGGVSIFFTRPISLVLIVLCLLMFLLLIYKSKGQNQGIGNGKDLT